MKMYVIVFYTGQSFWLQMLNFAGIYRLENSSSDLGIMILDNSTEDTLQLFEIDHTGRGSKVGEDADWKPRCRGWYVEAVRYTCDGSLEEIFGERDTFTDFYDYISDSGATNECQAAKVEYDDMFGIYKRL